MRKGEILGLIWSKVNLRENLITLENEDTKSRRRRIIPTRGGYLADEVFGHVWHSTLPLSCLQDIWRIATFAIMHTIVIDLPPETYKRLEEKARKAGQAVEVLSRELLETALASPEVERRQTARTVLQAAGRTRPLSDTLRSKIIPGVTLDEVRAILSRAAGPSLSDLSEEQRGTKL